MQWNNLTRESLPHGVCVGKGWYYFAIFSILENNYKIMAQDNFISHLFIYTNLFMIL